jgi:glycosyltransferase involved in cell wall biosynthesis
MTSQPLRILHLNASSSGGAFVAAQRLSDALNGLEGVSSEHWVFDGGEGEFHLWANTWLKKKWAFGLHALEKLDFLRFEANKSIRFAFSHGKTGVNVANWKAVQDADIIHLHWVNKGFVSLKGLEDLLGLGKKIVWTCHDMWPFTGGCYHPRGCDNFTHECGNCQYLKQPGQSDLSNQVFKAKKRIFSNAGGRLQFVTPSAWLKNQADKSGIVKELIDIGGPVAMPEIKVIPNPIDTDYFKPHGLNSVKGPMNYPFVLMFAAANLGNPAKGFAEFRSVCNGLVDLGFANIEALLVGENRLPNGDLGLKCAVKELGFISDAKQMRDAYWQADVYVTTSHEENLPTTIMESLSCGVPVAAFAVGGIPEMISPSGDHQTGWLSEKLDVKSLIQGIASYIEMEPSKRIKLQEASRNSAVANYGSVSIAQRYLEVYRS